MFFSDRNSLAEDLRQTQAVPEFILHTKETCASLNDNTVSDALTIINCKPLQIYKIDAPAHPASFITLTLFTEELKAG